MTKTFQWSGSVVVVAVVINLLLIQTIFADEPCGNIIKNGELQPIDNCDNPFNAIEAVPVDIVLEGTLITPDIDVTFNTTWGIFDIEPANPFNIALYKQEGSDYIFQQALPDSSIRLYRDQDIEIKKQLENEYYYNVINQQVNWSEVARNFDDIGYDYQYVYDFEHDYATYAGILPKGNYVLIFTSNDGPGGPDGPQLSLFEEVKNLLIPTAYAQGFPGGPQEVFSIPFTVNGGDVIIVPEPEIDELILQYAPILYFHPNEDYFPMDVESFVEASSLWSQDGIGDTQIHSSSSLTFSEFESVVNSGTDTSDMYLAFSDPDNTKSIDAHNAHVVYDNMRKTDTYATTTYYRRMVDGEYTVLQYWYFYAMNNWREVGGFNNHEGDWESVFIYLDESTENAEYIAYSAHHNDSNPNDGIIQYDSVRREWNSDEIVTGGDHAVSFVSLGSHANYPNNNAGEHVVPFIFPIEDQIDQTSTEGTHLNIESFSDLDSDTAYWTQYQGK